MEEKYKFHLKLTKIRKHTQNVYHNSLKKPELNHMTQIHTWIHIQIIAKKIINE